MKKSPLLFSNIQDFMSEPKVHTFSSETEWKSAAADEILRDAPEDMRIALSGGSTPAPVYEELATRRQDWSKSHVFVVDERFVPGDHPDSNQKLIKEHFSTNAQYHFWDTEKGDDWQESSEKYDKMLSQIIRPLDAIVLGIGPDGAHGISFSRQPC
jgi:6-phosphogluconolactonase